jgi:ribose/xylose/arabinose/galactoside ABC-type transport system permease subunit
MFGRQIDWVEPVALPFLPGIHGESRRLILMGFTMAAIARALYRTLSSDGEIDILKQVAMLSAAGLFISLLAMTYGIDLSPGFF